MPLILFQPVCYRDHCNRRLLYLDLGKKSHPRPPLISKSQSSHSVMHFRSHPRPVSGSHNVLHFRLRRLTSRCVPYFRLHPRSVSMFQSSQNVLHFCPHPRKGSKSNDVLHFRPHTPTVSKSHDVLHFRPHPRSVSTSQTSNDVLYFRPHPRSVSKSHNGFALPPPPVSQKQTCLLQHLFRISFPGSINFLPGRNIRGEFQIYILVFSSNLLRMFT